MKLTLKNKWIAAVAAVFIVLFVTTHAFAANTIFVGAAPATPADPTVDALGTLNNPYTSLQDAIDAANAGDTIDIADGTYSGNQFFVSSAKTGLTIDGTSTANTIIQLTAQFDGFKVQANNVTIENLTITSSATASYGLRAQGVDSLTVSNVAITNMLKSGFDINGVTNSTFTGLSAQNNGGNGISITDSKNLTFSNVTTFGNSWGGVALYATGASTFACGVDNVSFDSNASFGETGAVYTGIDNPTNPACTITNITLPVAVLPYKVTLAQGSRAQIDPQDIYTTSLANAVTVAAASPTLSPTIHSTADNTAVATTAAGLQAAITAANPGDTIDIGADITTTSEITISKSLTIDGQGHTLHATFPKTDNSNNAAIGIISTSNVTIENLTEDGTSSANLHGINVFESTNVNLNNVTVSNNSHNGLSVNGSTVTISAFTTSHNGWGGIDVDQPADAAGFPVVLTISGPVHQTESVLDIFRDDNSKDVTVTDTNNQYTSADQVNGSVTGTVFTLIAQSTSTVAQPQVMVTSSTQAINIAVDSGVTNPSIDVDSLVTASVATLPQIGVTSANADIAIAGGTIVTAADPSWNGIIAAPTVTTSYTLTADAGTTATVVLAVEIGAGDTPLSFSNAVKLTFPGQANNLVGWSQAGVFHAITDTCDNATTPTLAANADCRTTAGSDLIVWTKHFSTFITYTQTATASVGAGSGGGSSGGSAPVATTTASVPITTSITPSIAPVGQVLGAESFHFTLPLQISAHSDEVLQLQTRLNSDGAVLKLDSIFGPKTKAALIKWQKAHSLSADGVVGPKTRAALNA